MDILVTVISCLLILIALIAIHNVLSFPHLFTPSNLSQFPFVSILIPARNESTIISTTIRNWLLTEYPLYEILLLDDCSEDDTASIAREAANGDPRVNILQGDPVPTGWSGKNWACHQLSQIAQGDILLFTDSDVLWKPQALPALVSELIDSDADLLTIWPKQITETWSERLIVPLIGFTIIAYLPIAAVHSIPLPIFSAAIGQCLAFHRQAYEAIGGHEAIKTELLDDMAFARTIKHMGLRLRGALSGGLVTTHMYHNWQQVRDGFAKNILGGHGNSLIFLAFSTILHWLLFLFPWIWLFFDPLQGVILISLGILARALAAAVTRQYILDALLLPVSVLLMTSITLRAVHWRFSGGPRWRGRAYGH